MIPFPYVTFCFFLERTAPFFGFFTVTTTRTPKNVYKMFSVFSRYYKMTLPNSLLCPQDLLPLISFFPHPNLHQLPPFLDFMFALVKFLVMQDYVQQKIVDVRYIF